jgi:hypothetical protein
MRERQSEKKMSLPLIDRNRFSMGASLRKSYGHGVVSVVEMGVYKNHTGLV